MNYIEFFTKDNKSGWKTKEKSLKTHFNELYEQIINFSNENPELTILTFKEKIWHFIHNIKLIPRCKECNEKLKFGRSIEEGYQIFCSMSCMNKNDSHINSVKETNIKNHGVSCSLQIPSIVKDREDKLMHENGVTNYFYLKEKVRDDFIKKHGNIAPIQVKKISNKKNLEKYGVKDIKELPIISNDDEFIKKYCNLNIRYIGTTIVKIKCDKCKKNYEISKSILRYRVKFKIEPCIICNPNDNGVSLQEKEIVKFFKEDLKFHNIIENSRNIIKPYEIDIFLPDKKLGVEFNGLYWHSDGKKDNDYHIKKTKLAINHGVQLFHIFEDEWIFKQDIVKSILRVKLGFFEKKINSVDCIIKKIGIKEKKKFLNENHIDGDCNDDIRIGIFNNNELILVSTLKLISPGVFEILRFCQKLNYMTIYAMNMVLKYVKKYYKPKKLSVIVDNRYSNGNLFIKYGFKKVLDIEPSCWFVIGMERVKEHSEESKFKIYDAGYIKLELNL